MIDLERALLDVAEHLDHPAGDHLAEAVRARISAPAARAGHAPRRTRALIAIAAVLVLVAAAVAVAPARRAIADWLGIGAVEIRVSDHPLPTGTSARTVPGAPGTAHDAGAAKLLADARRSVDFPIATPPDSTSGALAAVELDRRVRGGLVALSYRRFTIVEIATDPSGPTFGKLLDPSARSEAVTVSGEPGLWIVGAHQIGYLDRSGAFEADTVRRSGPVLVWAKGGVTYRIEGLVRPADAQAVARSLR